MEKSMRVPVPQSSCVWDEAFREECHSYKRNMQLMTLIKNLRKLQVWSSLQWYEIVALCDFRWSGKTNNPVWCCILRYLIDSSRYLQFFFFFLRKSFTPTLSPTSFSSFIHFTLIDILNVFFCFFNTDFY